jgi:hypothetical protein
MIPWTVGLAVCFYGLSIEFCFMAITCVHQQSIAGAHVSLETITRYTLCRHQTLIPTVTRLRVNMPGSVSVASIFCRQIFRAV